MKQVLKCAILLCKITGCKQTQFKDRPLVFNSMTFSREQILTAVFEWNVGRMILAPRNLDTVYLIENAYTKNLNLRCNNGKAYLSLPLKKLKKNHKPYIILDRIIYGSNYAVVSIFSFGESYFTGIVRNINGKAILTDPSFSYDIFPYSKMKAEGFVE